MQPENCTSVGPTALKTVSAIQKTTEFTCTAIRMMLFHFQVNILWILIISYHIKNQKVKITVM